MEKKWKKCLRYNIVPFIIEDNLKMFYDRGLKEWNNEKGYLKDTCQTAQDRYKTCLDYFRIPYEIREIIRRVNGKQYEKEKEEQFNE